MFGAGRIPRRSGEGRESTTRDWKALNIYCKTFSFLLNHKCIIEPYYLNTLPGSEKVNNKHNLTVVNIWKLIVFQCHILYILCVSLGKLWGSSSDCVSSSFFENLVDVAAPYLLLFYFWSHHKKLKFSAEVHALHLFPLLVCV